MRVRRLLVLLWVAGTLAFATQLGGEELTQGLLLPWLRDLGFDELWAQRGHKVLRKSGHVLAYAGFALLVWWTLAGVRARATKAFLVVLGLAVIDEAIQFFSAGRGARVLDVVLDVTAGGLAILWLERRARRRAAPPGPSGAGVAPS